MIYFVLFPDTDMGVALPLIQTFRENGIECQLDLTRELSVSGQKREAKRLGATHLCYVGLSECESRNMRVKQL